MEGHSRVLGGDKGLDALGSLRAPIPRRLYRLVVNSPDAVDRDEAAVAVGINRAQAGYHLDRLAADGLVDVIYRRRNGRSGPGAGRPAKLYQPAPVEVSVQFPQRDDAFVGHLLADAIENDSTGGSRDALRTAASAAGVELGREIRGGGEADIVGLLDQRGYAPQSSPDGIRLHNCPFHHLVEDHRELVCRLNLDLLAAAVRSAEVPWTAALDPQPDMCCVVLRPANLKIS